MLSKSFPANYFENKKKFEQLLLNSDLNNTWNLILVNKNLIGVLLNKNTHLNYFGINLSVYGISYMAIDPDFQNMSVANKLKNIIFEESYKNDVSLGFSRKKMDGYWRPYGFVGATNFSETEFLLSSISTKIINNNYKLVEYNSKYKKNIIEFYNQNKSFQTGDLQRTPYEWKSILNNSKLIRVMLDEEKFIGYMFFKDNIISEIRCDKLYLDISTNLVKGFFKKLHYSNIVFCINLNDYFLKYLKKFSYYERKKYVFEGGHVVRLNNFHALFNKIEPLILNRVKAINILPFNICSYGLNVEYDGQRITFNYDNSKIVANDYFNITKLFFGLANMEDPRWKILFPNSNFQVSLHDQF